MFQSKSVRFFKNAQSQRVTTIFQKCRTQARRPFKKNSFCMREPFVLFFLFVFFFFVVVVVFVFFYLYLILPSMIQ